MRDYRKNITNISDAFLTLNEIDEEEALSLVKDRNARERLRKTSRERKLKEGRSYPLRQLGDSELEEVKKFIHKNPDDIEIEVIDANADSVDHVKENKDYIGQAILCCCKCKSNRFIDLDKLVASDNDKDLYNVDDECPFCKSDGEGFELIGQVGKVEEPSVELENDESDAEGEAFENDFVKEEPQETEEESEEVEEPAEEKEEVEDEEEIDAMETSEHEDDLEPSDDDISLEDIIEESLVKDGDEEVTDFLKGEYIHEAKKRTNYAEEAWLMNNVISGINNEEAYFSSWLYIWPDGCSKDECEYYFGNAEDFEELKQEFIDTYKAYHSDGLFDVDKETLEYARKWDVILGLPEIEHLRADFIREEVEDEEEFKLETVGDLFSLIVESEDLENVVIDGVEQKEISEEILEQDFKSFNVGEGFLVAYVSEDDGKISVEDLLSKFDDEESFKISLMDSEEFEEVITGSKEEVLEKCGTYFIDTLQKPEHLVISISDREEKEVEESLFEEICKVNKLASYRADKADSTEFWIKESLETKEDLDIIYRDYVKGTKLAERFKSEYNYTPSDESRIIREGFTNEEMIEYMDLCNELGLKTGADIVKFAQEHGNVKDHALLDAMRLEVAYRSDKDAKADKKQLKRCCDGKCELSVDGGKTWEECSLEEFDEVPYEEVICESKIVEEKFPSLPTYDPLEDKFAEDNISEEVVREDKIPTLPTYDPLEESVDEEEITEEETEVTEEPVTEVEAKVEDTLKDLRSEEKDAIDSYEKAIDEISEIEAAESEKEEIIATLNHIKEEEEEHVEELNAHLPEEGEESEEEDYITETKITSFKTRKELAEAITDCKNNKRPCKVVRSEKEGFRFDLVEERHVCKKCGKEKYCCECLNESVEGFEFPLRMLEEENPNYWDEKVFKKILLHFGIDNYLEYEDLEIGESSIRRDEHGYFRPLVIDLEYHVSDDDLYFAFQYYLESNIDNIWGDDDSAYLTEEQFKKLEEKTDEIIQYIKDFYEEEAIEWAQENYEEEDGRDYYEESVSSEPADKIEESNIPELPTYDPLEENINEEVEREDDPVIIDLKPEETDEIEETEPEVEPEAEEAEEEIELPIEDFDKDMNEWFKEVGRENVSYRTVSGDVDEKGKIVLEGILSEDNTEKNIVYVLTPKRNLTEAFDEKEIHKNLYGEKFVVENNLSDEKFEFEFENNTPDSELFDKVKEQRINMILSVAKEIKEEKDLNRKELIDLIAEKEYNKNKFRYIRLGWDASHVRMLVSTVIDEVEL